MLYIAANQLSWAVMQYYGTDGKQYTINKARFLFFANRLYSHKITKKGNPYTYPAA